VTEVRRRKVPGAAQPPISPVAPAGALTEALESWEGRTSLFGDAER
jgi:hypothetical protein